MPAEVIQIKYEAKDIGQFVSSAEKANSKLGSLFDRVGSGPSSFNILREVAVGAFREIGASIFNLTVSAGKELAKIGIDIVNTGATFEKSLSGIQAVSQLPAEAMGNISKKAEELGSSTEWSATQVANGMEMLAKNGLELEQIMGGAIDNTLALASATGSDLPTAADIMTDAMSLWNKEAGDLKEVINGISGVTVNSKFDINDYALAIAQGGGVAASVGVEFEDFNAAVSAISSSFSGGSDAGTSLKVMLQRLIPASDAAEAAMSRLGLMSGNTGKQVKEAEKAIERNKTLLETAAPGTERYAELQARLADAYKTVEEGVGRNEFFTANGRDMKSMAEIAELLSSSLEGVSDEVKLSTLSDIFGTDAMRAASALADVGGRAFSGISDGIREVDAAEQAEVRLDNFSGSMTKLQSAVEGVKISIAQELLPVLRGFVDNFVIPFVTENGPKLTEWLQAVLPSAINFSVTAVSSLSSVFGSAITWIQNFITSTDFSPLQSVFGSLKDTVTNAINSVQQKMSLISTVFQGVISLISGLIHGNWTSVWESFKSIFTGAWDLVVVLMKERWNSIKTVLTAFGVDTSALEVKVSVAASRIRDAFTSISNWFTNVALPAMAPVADFLGKSLVKAFDLVETGVGVALKILSNLSDWFGGTALPVIQPVVDIIGGALASAFTNTSNEANSGFFSTMKTIGSWIISTFSPLVSSISDLIKNVLGTAFTAVSDVVTNVIFPAITSFGSFLAGTFSSNNASAVGATDSLKNILIILANFISNQVVPTLVKITDWLGVVLPPIITAAVTLFGAVFKNTLVAVQVFIQNIFLPALNLITNWLSVVVTGAVTLFTTSFTIVREVLAGIVPAVNVLATAFTKLSTWLGVTLGEKVELAKISLASWGVALLELKNGAMTSFLNTSITFGMNVLQGITNGLANEEKIETLKSAVSSLFGEGSPTANAVNSSLDTIVGYGKQVSNWLADGIKSEDKVQYLKDTVVALLGEGGAIRQQINALTTTTINAGKNIATWLINGIKSEDKVQYLKDTVVTLLGEGGALRQQINTLTATTKNAGKQIFSWIASGFSDEGKIQELLNLSSSIFGNGGRLVYHISTFNASLLQVGRTIADSIFNGISEKWAGSVSWLIIGNLNLLKDTINSLVGIGSDVWHSGRRLVDSFFDGIVNKWNEIKNYLWVITGWGDGFAGSIHRLVEGNSDVVAAGKAIVEGLWRGLHDHWYDWLHDKVDDLAGRLPQWLKDKLGISSPAKALIPIGKSSAEGVEEGWSKRIPELKKKVELSVGDIAVKANSVAKAPSPSLSSNTRATPPPTPSQIMSSAPPRAGDTSVVNNYNLSVSRPPGAQVETEFATMAALNRR